MNLLTFPSTNYLLGASLESMHKESCEWLEEISFWQSEMAFFYKLVNKRMPVNGFPSEQLSALEKELIDIQTSKIDKTKKEIVKHEQSLALLLQDQPSGDEEDFREEHHNLLIEIYNIQSLIKRFKGKVFSLF